MSGKEVILTITADLFYENGYNNTGLTEILNKSNIAKTSIYHHFGSKAGLGSAYLELKRETLFKRIEKWTNKRQSLSEYLSKWVLYLKKSIKENQFYGCPFAGFSYQLSVEDQEIFVPQMKEIVDAWLVILTDFITSLQKNKKVRNDIKAREIASDMLAIYQGYVTLWKLTKDSRNIDSIEKKFKELAKNVETQN
ncbi:TetR/AcrR family transcriptional regulator [Leptospira meyeri]|uniref:TetR/AcrR family transcriptional regulator n=1 Tax=Leptospira meyeri TaxID=29508 RepID=UPI0002BEFDCA|nr:TetR/AcrR family transcriptional regulator [Leptospira meyeri]EMJ89636.1 transcriptional regulator, TetR family [Leptospira meyeri serovar Semaranga str. Veldrot Semarang 173]